MQQFTETLSIASAGQGKKRKQVGIACSNCRQSKTACDEARPCSRCVARGLSNCVDAPKKRRTKKATTRTPPTKKHKPNKEENVAIASKLQPHSPSLPITPLPLCTSPKLYPRVSSKDTLPLLPLSRVSSGELLPSINQDFSPFNDDSPNISDTDMPDSGDSSPMDCSSTPFLSLKYTPNPHSPLFHHARLPPISSTAQYELPFRTVAEPTVDLFSDTLHKPRPRNISFSDEALEISGIRKNPSLETLMANVLKESEANSRAQENKSGEHPR